MIAPNGGMAPDELELVRDLRAAGYELDSIWDWVNQPVAVPGAVPIMLDHLRRASEPRVVEGIARALTNRHWPEAERPLVEKFAEVEDMGTRWAIANAIVTVGFSHSEDEVLHYATDPRYGWARELLVGALYKIRRPEVENLLLELLADHRLDIFAAGALAYCGGPRAVAALEAVDLSGRAPRAKQGIPKALKRLKKRLDRMQA